ncbi:MAG: hypothetical protein IJ682_13470 [Lachnospiraceae bacterium]|nr:hypothetical protein [Lachnospiraceae bacterium]
MKVVLTAGWCDCFVLKTMLTAGLVQLIGFEGHVGGGIGTEGKWQKWE